MSYECKVDGCSTIATRRAMCNNHYRRFMKYGDPLFRKQRSFGEGTPHINGYWMFEINKRHVLRHVLVVEKILGRRLPKRVVVHHIDEDRSNDVPSNLVVCQDNNYHQLLHRRKRALRTCGHADWIKCQICKQYSPAEELKIYNNNVKWHSACWAKKFGRKEKTNVYVQASH